MLRDELGIPSLRGDVVRLRILAWGVNLGPMSKGLRQFRVQPFTESGEPVLNPRVVATRTEDGAVKRLVRWMQWEGYTVEGLCVHIEELPSNG